MEKLCSILCACILLMMSACSSPNSKIESYQKALENGDIEKAASILSSLSSDNLSKAQVRKINNINDQYLVNAVDAYIDEYEELMEKGKIEKAIAMWVGVPDNAITVSQAERIAQINLKFAKNTVNAGLQMAGDMMDAAEGMKNAAELPEALEDLFK